MHRWVRVLRDLCFRIDLPIGVFLWEQHCHSSLPQWLSQLRVSNSRTGCPTRKSKTIDFVTSFQTSMETPPFMRSFPFHSEAPGARLRLDFRIGSRSESSGTRQWVAVYCAVTLSRRAMSGQARTPGPWKKRSRRMLTKQHVATHRSLRPRAESHTRTSTPDWAQRGKAVNRPSIQIMSYEIAQCSVITFQVAKASSI